MLDEKRDYTYAQGKQCTWAGGQSVTVCTH